MSYIFDGVAIGTSNDKAVHGGYKFTMVAFYGDSAWRIKEGLIQGIGESDESNMDLTATETDNIIAFKIDQNSSKHVNWFMTINVTYVNIP